MSDSQLREAILIFATDVKRISASAMLRHLRLAYQTAFVLIHKLRDSIVEAADAANVTQLDGQVTQTPAQPAVTSTAADRCFRARVTFTAASNASSTSMRR